MRNYFSLFFLLLITLIACKDENEVLHEITVSVEPNNAGMVSCPSGPISDGASVTFKATPNGNYIFTGWSGSLSGTENPMTVTVNRDMNVIANFSLRSYPLIISVEGKGHVEEKVVSTRVDYKDGTVVELSAVADEFWAFDHWEGIEDSLINPLSVTVTNSISIKAVFVEKDPGIVFTEVEYISPYEINKRLGLGLNLGSEFEIHVVDGVANEYFKVTQQAIDKMRAAGFKNIRIPFIWDGRIGPAPDYKIDDEWFDRLGEVIGYAENAGMIVYFNFHHDCPPSYLDLKKASTDPEYNNKTKELISAVWKQIARKFRDKGDFLMFESLNEPESGDGFFWGWHTPEEMETKRHELNCLNEWNQTFVDAVRSTGGNNATRWLIVVGPAAKPRNLPYFKIPKDYVSNNRLLVSAHIYEPEHYVFGELPEWGHTADRADEEIWIFDEEFIAKQFEDLRINYMDKGIAICVNEVGCQMRDNEREKAFMLYYTEYLSRAAALNGIALNFFDSGNIDQYSLQIFDRETGDYVRDGKEYVDVIYKATYSDDPTYTLQSIYDRAPFSIDIDTSNVAFSDVEFEQYIMNEYDKDHDNNLSWNELQRIYEINISTDNINSLTGIERMPNLKKVRASGSSKGNGKLTNIDFSNNHHLEEICLNYNAISEINLQGCSKLRVLECWENNLRSLDVSSCASLEELYCAQNNIEAIDFSKNPNLEVLAVNDNKFSSIDLVNNVRLKILECGGNKFTTIDASRNGSLESLNTVGCPDLSTIYLAESQEIDSIEKDSHTSFAYRSWLAIGDTAFEEYLLTNFDTNHDGGLSLEEAENIQEISLPSNNVQTIIAIKYMTSLRSLIINGEDGNKGLLQEIDLSNNPNMEILSFFTNSVKKLNIKGCNKLKSILCWGNKLSEIDLSDCPDLEILLCAQNDFSSIDVSHCPKLKSFCPNDCKLTVLDLSNNPALEEVEIQGNPDLDYVYLKHGQTIPHFIKGVNTEISYK